MLVFRVIQLYRPFQTDVIPPAWSSFHPHPAIRNRLHSTTPPRHTSSTANNAEASLHLETPRPSASTSALELPALALDIRLLPTVRPEAEMLNSLACVLGTPQQQRVSTGGRLQRELIDGEALAAGGLDPGAGGRGEAERGDRELGHGEEAVVIGDGADDDDRLALVRLARVLVRGDGDDARDRHGGAVHARHEEAAEDDFVEVRVGTALREKNGTLASCISWSCSRFFFSDLGGVSLTGKEAVQLHQQLEVDIVALRGLAMPVADVMTVQVDTCRIAGSLAHFSLPQSLHCLFVSPSSIPSRNFEAIRTICHFEQNGMQ